MQTIMALMNNNGFNEVFIMLLIGVTVATLRFDQQWAPKASSCPEKEPQALADPKRGLRALVPGLVALRDAYRTSGRRPLNRALQQIYF